MAQSLFASVPLGTSYARSNGGQRRFLGRHPSAGRRPRCFERAMRGASPVLGARHGETRPKFWTRASLTTMAERLERSLPAPPCAAGLRPVHLDSPTPTTTCTSHVAGLLEAHQDHCDDEQEEAKSQERRGIVEAAVEQVHHSDGPRRLLVSSFRHRRFSVRQLGTPCHGLQSGSPHHRRIRRWGGSVRNAQHAVTPHPGPAKVASWDGASLCVPDSEKLPQQGWKRSVHQRPRFELVRSSLVRDGLLPGSVVVQRSSFDAIV